MKENDRLALQLAAERYAARYGAEHFRGRVKQSGWLEAAKSAAYVLQFANLGLEPWQIPPAKIINPDRPDEGLLEDQPGLASDGRKQAASLLRRMLTAGVSKFNPDPLRACEEAERAKPSITSAG
jgi:hypothetical protein